MAALATASLTVVLPAAPASAGSAAAAPGAASELLGDIESLRASRGLAGLTPTGELNAKAQAWALNMASAGRLSHSSLTSGISSPWTQLGENVGMGPTVAQINADFIASPAHYGNLVQPSFTLVGVGAATDAAGTLYVTEEFEAVGSVSRSAPPPPPYRPPPVVRPPAVIAPRPVTTAPAAAPPPAPVPVAPAVEPAPPPPAVAMVADLLATLRTFDATGDTAGRSGPGRPS